MEGRFLRQQMADGSEYTGSYYLRYLQSSMSNLQSALSYLPQARLPLSSAALAARRRVLAIRPLIRRPTDSARSRSSEVLADNSV